MKLTSERAMLYLRQDSCQEQCISPRLNAVVMCAAGLFDCGGVRGSAGVGCFAPKRDMAEGPPSAQSPETSQVRS